MHQDLSHSRAKSGSTIINPVSGNVMSLEILNLSTYALKKKKTFFFLLSIQWTDFIYIKTLIPARNSSSWTSSVLEKIKSVNGWYTATVTLSIYRRLNFFFDKPNLFTIRFHRLKITQSKCYKMFLNVYFQFLYLSQKVTICHPWITLGEVLH